MLRQGFSATTVDVICAKSKVTKGAFFHHFKSKDDLGKAVLAYHCQLSGGLAARAAYRNEKDPVQRVLKYADFVVDSVRDPIDDGCLIGVFASEMSRTQKPIREMCAMAFAAWTEDLRSMLDAVAVQKKPAREIDSTGLAGYFIAVFEGGLVLAKAQNDVAPLRAGIHLWKEHVKSIFGISGG